MEALFIGADDIHSEGIDEDKILLQQSRDRPSDIPHDFSLHLILKRFNIIFLLQNSFW